MSKTQKMMKRLRFKNQPSTNIRKDISNTSTKKWMSSLIIILAILVIGFGNVWGQADTRQQNTTSTSRLKNMAAIGPLMPMEKMINAEVKSQNASTTASTEAIQENVDVIPQIENNKEIRIELKKAIELFSKNLDRDKVNQQKLDEFIKKTNDEQRIKQINDVLLLAKSENLENNIEMMVSNQIQVYANIIERLNSIITNQK